MNLGEQIRINRKKIGLTQEQVADYLGVSTPAVNKWERGTTCPDISLLPALARLLDIDMNELFSFREELTELEIGLFINELSETAQEVSTDAAFTMAEKKLHEYPRCDSLRYHCALILNSVLTLNGFKDEQAKYEETILSWLTQAAESSDDRTRLSALCILASKYIQRNEHEKATMLLEQIPDITIDKALLQATILTRQESPDAAAAMLEAKLLQTLSQVQSYLYRLLELEEVTGHCDRADQIARSTVQMVQTFGMWDYGSVVPMLLLALYRKQKDESVRLIRQTLEEAQKPWMFQKSPLFCRIPPSGASGNLGKNFIRSFLAEIDTDEGYAFLRDSDELREVLSKYRMEA